MKARYALPGCLMGAGLILAVTPLAADELPRLSPVVITASPMTGPGVVTTDPRQPRLPLPAHDGGAYLGSIPGFTVSRKGGTSGDPELRGLGGSRLSILLDDAPILGGCGGRMDPPTAYVYPQAYEHIEVTKGPQSVRYGASPAGVVRFEREAPQFETAGEVRGFTGITVGRFDRFDLITDIATGNEHGYIRGIGTLSDQSDYRDGDGNTVHSQYSRWSGTGIVGWRPDDDTLVEFTLDRSDAEAAYDDRGMDGTQFERTGYSLAVTRERLAPWLDQIEARVFYNAIDHVMDNFTLREPPGMPMVSYPDRVTTGARLAADFVLPGEALLHAGAEYQRNRHRGNRLMGMAALGWRDVPRNATARFRDTGVFAELEYPLTDTRRLVTGLRMDRSRAEAQAENGFGGAAAGSVDSSNQMSGFLRVEQDFAAWPATGYLGIGRAERAADFWERRRVFELETETLTQLDLGVQVHHGDLTGSLAVFYGQFDDYILIAREAPEARNVDATTYGAELDLAWALHQHWTARASAAWVRAQNDSDGVPLAQTPPAELTLGLEYAAGNRFAGAQVRGVARQDRVHLDHGTIYSLDTEETPGFATAAVYAGMEVFGNSRVTFGIDNLFDRSYREHIQRGQAELGTATRSINEPGRTLWANWTVEF